MDKGNWDNGDKKIYNFYFINFLQKLKSVRNQSLNQNQNCRCH